MFSGPIENFVIPCNQTPSAHCTLHKKYNCTISTYLLISYCGTPLVYYIGLEENRRQARDYIRSRVGVVRGPGGVAPSPDITPPPAGEVFTLAPVDTNNPVHNIPGQVEEQHL